MLLRLTYGNETITLSGGTVGIRGCTYRPYSPAADTTRQLSTFKSGSVPTSITYRNVEEPCEVVFDGATTDVQAALSDIRRFAALAEAGQPVYIEHRMRDTGTIYRSPLYRANIDYSENPGLRRFEGATSKGKINIAWERGYYWEGSRTQIALRSSLDGPTYEPVRANLDHRGWVQIAANQISGTEPAPVELRVVQNVAAQINWRNFYFANNAFHDPASFDFHLSTAQIETGTGDLSWSTSTHATTRIRANLSQINILAANSADFRIIASFNTMSAKTYVKAYSGTTVGGIYRRLAQTSEVYTGDVTGRRLLDLGTLQIPPSAPGTATYYVGLMLSMRSAGAGFCNINALYLHPAKNSRRLYQDGYGIPQGGVLVDDGIENASYVLSSAIKHAIIIPYDQPLLVYPEMLQRIYLLYDESAGAFSASRSIKVQAFYRPRRLSV